MRCCTLWTKILQPSVHDARSESRPLTVSHRRYWEWCWRRRFHRRPALGAFSERHSETQMAVRPRINALAALHHSMAGAVAGGGHPAPGSCDEMAYLCRSHSRACSKIQRLRSCAHRGPVLHVRDFVPVSSGTLMATQMPPAWTKTQLEGLDRQNLRCRAMDLAAFLKVDLPSLTAECVISRHSYAHPA
jgi:hypothetical protein